MLFPLPLVPFEEYMLLDDRPGHPMSFFLKLIFSGDCDPQQLDAALQVSLERHPLLSATVVQTNVQTKQKQFAWAAGRPERCAVQWVTGDRPVAVTPIDLFAQPGLRVSAWKSDQKTTVQFQFHHACCDGMGALRWIEDLLVAYSAGVKEAASAPWRPIEQPRLRGRARFGLTPWKLLRLAPQLSVGLLGARQFLMRQPVPLQSQGPGPPHVEKNSATAGLPANYPASQSHQFSVAETARFVAAARRLQGTVNDLLMRDVFLTLAAFRASRELAENDAWLRLTVPVNLRSVDDQQLPAANVVSMVFLDRNAADCEDPASLLAGIGQEMQLIKRNRLGVTFPLSLQFVRYLPGAMARLQKTLDQPVCRGSAVLSNLGRSFLDAPLSRCDGKLVAGKMTLEKIEFLPPVRPQTTTALGVCTYADRLQIALHYDPRALAATDASWILQEGIRRIKESAD
jgi:NRPS condensation-like uncharacterized protein